MHTEKSSSPASSSISIHEIPEPLILNKYQNFKDLPPIQLRKGIDDEGNPWSPDLLIARADSLQGDLPATWAMKTFAGKNFMKDFVGAPEVLESLESMETSPFWVVRMENQKSKRKLLTVRLYAAPAGYEDESLAWTPIDKFLFEIEPKQAAAVARQVNLAHLWESWTHRNYFRDLDLPRDMEEASDGYNWVFIAALVTDAALDHPENVCHCGSVQACQATAEGLDRRDPRYPFNQIFKHSIRTTFPLLNPAAMRMFRLGRE